MGRFTQSDPSGQEAKPYLYATGDPTNRIDPTGLFGWSDASAWALTTAINAAALFVAGPIGGPIIGGCVSGIILQGFAGNTELKDILLGCASGVAAGAILGRLAKAYAAAKAK